MNGNQALGSVPKFLPTKYVTNWFVAYHKPPSNSYWVNDPHVRQFHSGDANIWISISFPNFLWRNAKCVSGNLALSNSDFYSDDVSNSFNPIQYGGGHYGPPTVFFNISRTTINVSDF